MEQELCIRRLSSGETTTAIALAWKVFTEYEAPDYSEEGIEEFHRSIQDEGYLSSLCAYGAYLSDALVGMVATRKNGTHIALFFVNGAHHRRGIGKRLFQAALSDCPADRMTVNSSPYAVPVYHRLGFSDISAEQTVSGIRFTPMEYKR